ncbi:MAG: hypothetical protein AAF620_12235 [Bacteroidota bacterium]
MIYRKDVFEFEMIQYCDKENLRTIFNLLPHFGDQVRSSSDKEMAQKNRFCYLELARIVHHNWWQFDSNN